LRRDVIVNRFGRQPSEKPLFCSLRRDFDLGAQSQNRNIFGALRLFFAVAVIFDHTWEVNFLQRQVDPLSHLFPDVGTGPTAVVGFFAVSGLLISQSAVRNSARRFLTLRAARIYPGWLVAVFVVGLGLEPILYLLVHRTLAGAPWSGTHSMLSYSVLNVGVVQLQTTIPGVVSHGMLSDVDGPLWTIKWEIFCYLVGLLCVVLGRRLKHNSDVALAWSICIAMVGIRLALADHLFSLAETRQILPVCLDLFAFFLCFGIGLRRHDWLSNRWLCGGVLAGLIGLIALHAWTEGGEFLFPVAVATVGSMPIGGRLAAVGRRRDLSYGMYLYAWPVQQMLAARHVLTGQLYLLVPVAVLLTAPLALGSWWLIESPALRLAHRTGRSTSGAPRVSPEARTDVTAKGAATPA
jgi:peptidoglycan/LPS O-acetylase OafA/YrhL